MPNPPHTPWPNQWLEGYLAAQSRNVHKPQQEDGEEPMQPMMGGWKFEGKEKPETPNICPKCQGIQRDLDKDPTDQKNWCDDCVSGNTPIGFAPTGPHKASVSKLDDVMNYNKAFFG